MSDLLTITRFSNLEKPEILVGKNIADFHFVRKQKYFRT